jgi:hypothetical protein
LKAAQEKRIRAAFTHHPPIDESQVERYQLIRGSLYNLAVYLCDLCPDSCELNKALNLLDEAQYWALAAIDRNES